MPHAHTEDQLVEQPAIGLFAEVGWSTLSAMEEAYGATGTLLRETKGEAVLLTRLRAASERLNPAVRESWHIHAPSQEPWHFGSEEIAVAEGGDRRESGESWVFCLRTILAK